MARAFKTFPLIAIGGLLACLILGARAWAQWPTAERGALGRYSSATCVSPVRSSDRTTWDTTIPLGNGKSARVRATGDLRSMFELTFSDEDYRRDVTTFWDYSYPRDARVTRSTNTLWLVVSGGLGGGTLVRGFDRARLYEYDLASRAIAHEYDIQPSALPQACPPSTLLETATTMR